MSKQKLISTTAITVAILLGVTLADAALAGDMGMGYANQPPPPNAAASQQQLAKPKASGPMRPEIVKPLKDTIDLINKKDFQGALAKVKEADAVTDKNPLEEYNVTKLLGYISVQLHDYPGAGTAYHRALATNVAPAEELPQILKGAMALDASNKDFHSAISEGDQLQKLGPLDATATETLAESYYFTGDYPNALKAARAAVDMESANGGTPNLQPLEIILDVQVKTKDHAGVKQTLATLCSLPNPSPDLQCSQAKKK